MTDYVPYTPDEYAPDAPGTALHFQRWFENWIAGFEGAPGAPRLNPIGAVQHQGQAGAIGTYVFARRTAGTADVAFGSTLAGSSLSPTSASMAHTDTGGSTGNGTFNTGSNLSGTWRCMGTYDHTTGSSGTTMQGATLWLRIA